MGLILGSGLAFGQAPDKSDKKDMPPEQTAEWGKITRLIVPSDEMQEDIVVDVLLPEGYDLDKTKRYPVIYMHDGQNLYDAKTTWNHQAWEMDLVTGALVEAKEIETPIIVGVHSSSETRVADLMPIKAVQGIGLEGTLDAVKLHGRKPRGDAYAAFLAKTLKPTIDKKFRTLPEMENTTVMGSSMGGLMSIYALCEYPDVFGNAICMSTHWTGAPEVQNEFAEGMYRYIDGTLPTAGKRGEKTHRLYFDHGTATIDAAYGPYETKILEMIRRKGYGPGTLKNMVAKGAPHEERAWSARVSIPLRFLLGPQ